MTRGSIGRRDFLTLRLDGGGVVELSCERLYMRYADARAAGTVDALFDALAADLESVRTVRLNDTAWLSDADLRRRLDAVLAVFRDAGGRIDR